MVIWYLDYCVVCGLKLNLLKKCQNKYIDEKRNENDKKLKNIFNLFEPKIFINDLL